MAFDVPALALQEPCCPSPLKDPHVGSIMLAEGMLPFVSLFALLNDGAVPDDENGHAGCVRSKSDLALSNERENLPVTRRRSSIGARTRSTRPTRPTPNGSSIPAILFRRGDPAIKVPSCVLAFRPLAFPACSDPSRHGAAGPTGG